LDLDAAGSAWVSSSFVEGGVTMALRSGVGAAKFSLAALGSAVMPPR
jgi:hypothetical protein